MSTSDETRRLNAENHALRAVLEANGAGHAVAPTIENVRLRILLADVRTALLAAGWKDDALLARLNEEVPKP